MEKEYAAQAERNMILTDIEHADEIALNLRNVTTRVFHTVSPHSEDAACVYILEEKVVFLGDAASKNFFNGGSIDRAKLN